MYFIVSHANNFWQNPSLTAQSHDAILNYDTTQTAPCFKCLIHTSHHIALTFRDSCYLLNYC